MVAQVKPAAGVSGVELMEAEPFFKVSMAMARLVQPDEAIFLANLHFWPKRYNGDPQHTKMGRTWVYNTYGEWAAQLPFTERQIRRIVASLKAKRLIEVRRFDAYKWQQQNHYTLRYDQLEDLDTEAAARSEEECRAGARLQEVGTGTHDREDVYGVTDRHTVGGNQHDDVPESAASCADAHDLDAPILVASKSCLLSHRGADIRRLNTEITTEITTQITPEITTKITGLDQPQYRSAATSAAGAARSRFTQVWNDNLAPPLDDFAWLKVHAEVEWFHDNGKLEHLDAIVFYVQERGGADPLRFFLTVAAHCRAALQDDPGVNPDEMLVRGWERHKAQRPHV